MAALLTALVSGLPVTVGATNAAAADRTTAAPSVAANSPTPANSPTARTGSRSATLSVDALTPSVPRPGDTLTVSGTVTNRTGSPLGDAEVGVRTGPVMNSRSAMDEAVEREGYLPGSDGVEADGDHSEELPGLAPGMTRPFSLQVPVKDLNLKGEGVYQLTVTLSGQAGAQQQTQILGAQRTFLPWQKDEPENKLGVTAMWPLLSSPQLTARTEADDSQTPVFRSDDLQEAIAPGGRLQQLVALGSDLPITWVVDPDLLASVEAMTEDYKVRTDDGRVVSSTDEDEKPARDWLKDLREAVRGKEVVALPYGDPDLASLAHRGAKVPGALGRLGPATEVGEDTVEGILLTEATADFAWPVDGAVDPSIVNVATSAGASNVIARSDSLRETGALPYTPGAARPIGGGTTALVADTRLSRAFDRDMTDAGAATGAVQRFLGETLSVADQVPSVRRTVLVAPQRFPTVSQAQAMATALRALQDSGWAQSTSLTDAAKATPDPGASRAVPGTSAYPDALRRQELPTSAFEEVSRTQRTLESFADVLARGDRVVTPIGRAIDREVSTYWRKKPAEAAEYSRSVQDYLDGLTQEVYLVEKSELVVAGRSGTIPITVQNNLIQGVDGLTLKLTSDRNLQLRIEDDEQPVVVARGRLQSVKFASSATANGRTTVTAQLYTRDGQRFGEEMRFQVRVTSIASTVLLVIAAGFLLVALAGVRMYSQRKRRGPMPDPDAPLAEQPRPAEETGAPADEGTHAGVPSADTGGESGGEPHPGERVER